MIKYIIASENEIDLMMKSRFEMLRIIDNVDKDYQFDRSLVNNVREYFLKGDHTTVLAMDGESVAGCATMCYLWMMPTLSHSTGKRAHLMNVYTDPEYRRQGIALKMVQMLIDKAREKGVTEISLDATDAGRPVYKKLGFTESEECMVITL